MTAVIADPELQRRLIHRRRERGEDRYDEIWDGVYVMNSHPNDEHQSIVSRMTFIFETVVGEPGLGKVRPGINISDLDQYWKENYRCPDVAVFLNTTTAINKRSHWLGGPDLAVEICSPHDKTRDKIEFYAKVRTQELMIIDRDLWAVDLYRLSDDKLKLAGRIDIDSLTSLETNTVPLRWRLVAGPERPLIEASKLDGSGRWLA